MIFFLQLFRKAKFAYPAFASIVLIFTLFQNLDVEKFAGNHWRNTETYWGKFMQNTADNTVIYKNLNRLISEDYVVAYCNKFEEIDCMFYSGITSYSYLDEKKLKELKLSGKKIAVFENNLPEFVTRDTSIYIIPLAYKGNHSPL